MTPKEVFEKKINALFAKIPDKQKRILQEFFDAYQKAALPLEEGLQALICFLDLLEKELITPFSFSPYHKKVRFPTDYYRFGIDFIRPLCDLAHSQLVGKENLAWIEQRLKEKENVIFLANHQVEADPQAIAILLEKEFPQLAEWIIYVAGERVVTDPMAIPFSMGCDLLCIYSKRYIDHPLEEKRGKQLHNQKTMELMRRLLEEGGKAIYVAPSGGRDRKNEKEEIVIAPFDPDSIEMFYLMAKKSKIPTHFVPLSLWTYELLPPPETIQIELGEKRFTKRTPIHLACGTPFDMELFPGSEEKDKIKKRAHRAAAIWTLVKQQCDLLKKLPA